MLTELKLSNFRIFDDEVSVRFRADNRPHWP